jgi:hypothetical protein
MMHDRPFHLAQRWLTYRRRSAIGDLFLGAYCIQLPTAGWFLTVRGARASQRVGSNAAAWLASSRRERTATSGSPEDLFAAAIPA